MLTINFDDARALALLQQALDLLERHPFAVLVVLLFAGLVVLGLWVARRPRVTAEAVDSSFIYVIDGTGALAGAGARSTVARPSRRLRRATTRRQVH